MSADIQPPVSSTHLFTFPPFPTPPANANIMPYKNFKERGICMEGGADEQEVDTLGIPTIPVRVRHAGDKCKTNTKRKRQEDQAEARKKQGLSTQREWWEQWEETEMIRFSTGFNPNSTRFERIHAAAQDFTNGRKWPLHFKSETGPRFIWEKFQRYLGIPEGGQTPQEKKKEDDDDDVSDDDMDGDDENAEETGNSAAIITDSALPALAANKKAIATNEEKLFEFFTNPEKSIKIFMSSFSRRMGYIWATENLTCIPRVIAFFIKFLIRSRVLPEVERNLGHSLTVIKSALEELPSIALIGKGTPDKFSLACNVCWGSQAESYSIVIPDRVESVENPQPATSGLIEVTEETAGNGEDDEAPAWGSGNNDNSPWGDSAAADAPWGIISEVEDPFVSWAESKQEDFFQFLGPTVLPLTHTTGIVERSMRRVKAITGPNPNPPSSVPQAQDGYEPNADGVDIELDRTFAKIILSPMIDWDGGEYPLYARPTILQTSQGPVVGAPETTEGTAGTKPHDAEKDDITLLVETKDVGLFVEGMAIGGTWIQLARKGEPAKKKKKSKSKSKKNFNGYWYLDEVAIITPSFWTVASD